MSKVDEAIIRIREAQMSRQITHLEMCKFFDLVSDALVNTLYHIADDYTFDQEVEAAADKILEIKTKH